jgi:putative Holliday junction resolvase
MKLLGIDFGSKRIGLALGDTETRLALPFKTVANDDKILANLKKIIDTDLIESLIIGKPVSLSGAESGETLDAINDFSAKIKEKTGLSVIFEDERFTSDMADSMMKFYGEKSDRDSVAAMIILQSYLDKLNSDGAV